MKRSLKIFLLVGGCIILNSSCNMEGMVNRMVESNENAGAIVLVKETFPVASIKELKVTTSGGEISVTGDADQEAILEMHVKPNRGGNLSTDEIQEILDRDYEIDIEERNGVLHAHAKRRGSLNWNNVLSISFKIRTGHRLISDLSTSGGGIQLAYLSGKQSFTTSGGGLDIYNVEGHINGKTSGGGIQAYDSQGTITLTTSGGSIELENLEGQVKVSTSGGHIKGRRIIGTLNAETSGGSISLDDLACKLKASTSGGSVTVGVRKLVDDVTVSTSAGNINLTIPENASADLDLEGSSVHATGMGGFSGSDERGHLRGRLNGGGARVDASASAGNVNLTVR